MITNNDTINYQTRDLLDVVADYTYALDTLDKEISGLVVDSVVVSDHNELILK